MGADAIGGAGSYLSYKGPGVKNVQRLLYPCPQEGLAGLGTHLVSAAQPVVLRPLTLRG